MAIAYSSAGSGVSTETSSAALSPACPATVNANDILIAHVFWEGTTTTPSTPEGWTLLAGPVLVTTVARHWVFGKIAAGTEDGETIAFGAPAVTTQRGARVYSFTGWESGSITDLAIGFSTTSHATDPQMPRVTTTVAGGLAVALVGQNDNNTMGSATGESGGDWTEAVAEYTANLTPGLAMQLQTCTPTANPGTVSGGVTATTDDPCGVIGFEIRPKPTPEPWVVGRQVLEFAARTSAEVPLPTARAGDLVLVYPYIESGASEIAVEGATQIAQARLGVTTARQGCFRLVYDGSSPVKVTWGGASVNSIVVVVVVRNYDAESPVDDASAMAAETSKSAANLQSVTTTVADALQVSQLVSVIGLAPTNVPTGFFTQVIYSPHVWSRPRPEAGATGTSEVTMAGTNSVLHNSLAVAPPAAEESEPADIPLAAVAGAATVALALTAAARVAVAAQGVATAALKLTAPTRVPLQTTAGTSTAALTASAATQVPLAPVAGLSTASAALSASTLVPLQAVTGVAAAAVAVSRPESLPLQAVTGVASAALGLTAPTYLPLASVAGLSSAAVGLTATPKLTAVAAGVATATVNVRAATQIPLAATAGVATAALSVYAPTVVPLAPVDGLSTAALALRGPPLLALTADGAATAALTLSAATAIPLQATAGVATAAMTVTVPGEANLGALAADGVAVALVHVSALTQLPLAPTAGESTAAAAVNALTRIPLAAVNGESTASASLVTTPQFSPTSTGAGTAALTVTVNEPVALTVEAAGTSSAALALQAPPSFTLTSAGEATATLEVITRADLYPPLGRERLGTVAGSRRGFMGGPERHGTPAGARNGASAGDYDGAVATERRGESR